MIDIIIWAFAIWILLRLVDIVITVVSVKEAETKIKDHLNKIIHDVTVEKHNDTEYWFDKETDEFLGQGQTRDDVAKHLKSRFPDHIFVLPAEGILCAPEWKLTKTIDPITRAKHYAATE
jgi:hypothetical protein